MTSPGGVFVRTPFDGCYSRTTRDNLNHDQQVLTLVGLTETLGRGVSSRVWRMCSLPGRHEMFLLSGSLGPCFTFIL